MDKAKKIDWNEGGPRSIVVRMPNWLGDLVMATPILEDLRKRFPSSSITAMCQSNVAGLLEHDPHIDEIFSFHRPSGWLHRQEFRDVIHTLRHGQYDLGLLLTNSFSSAWYFWRGNVKNTIGFKGRFRSWLLDHPVPIPKQIERQHQVITYKALLEPLGIPTSNTPPRLYLSAEEIRQAREALSQFEIPEDGVLIGINPGAAYGSAKCWLPDRFHALCEKLLENPKIFIAFFGDRSTSSLVQTVCDGLPARVINLAGKTNLRMLMAFIEQCNAFVTNDSGPMHIASALGTPLIALFGSTSDIRTSPYNQGTVIHKHVSCSPCYQRVCPIDFRCMKEITVDEVAAELDRLLSVELQTAK